MTGDNHDFGKFDNFGKFGKFGNFAKFNTLFDCRLVISEVNPINALEDQVTVVPPLTEDIGRFGKLRLYQVQFTAAQPHKSLLLSNLCTTEYTAEKVDVERAAGEKADRERAAEKANVKRTAADQAAAVRSKIQPNLSQVQFTSAQPHKFPLLSNLSTAEDAAEKADVVEDERPVAKNATHAATAVKADLERAVAKKANVERAAAQGSRSGSRGRAKPSTIVRLS